jgi:hypothetical protein
MNPEIIIDNESSTMWYYPDKKVIHHQIRKYIYGDELRNLLMTGVELLKKYRVTKWLSDDQSFAAMTPDDMKWGMQTFFPKAMEAGWRHWAVVLPKSTIGQMSHRRVIDDSIRNGLNAKMFSDVDDAMSWLEEQ